MPVSKKKFTAAIFLVGATLFIWSYSKLDEKIQQEHMGIHFQALLLNEHGQGVTNQAVSMEFQLYQAEDTSNAVYTERRCLLSDERGELVCKIGGNDSTNRWSRDGEFEKINWQNSSYFLQIITDGIQSKPLIPVPLSEKDPHLPGNLQENISWKLTEERDVHLSSSENKKDTEDILYIGKYHQGGKIAYLYQRGDNGYIEGEVHGIIAAEHDLPKKYSWGCEGVYLKALQENQNRSANVSPCEGAISICEDWVSNNFDDWHLPNLFEMKILYHCHCCIGGWEGGEYWTSEEIDADGSYMYELGVGFPRPRPKHFQAYVRPIRYF